MKFITRLRRDRVAEVLSAPAPALLVHFTTAPNGALAGDIATACQTPYWQIVSSQLDKVTCANCRDRVAELLTDDGLEVRLRHALRAEAERIVRDYCEPIPCDFEDNYVCAAHRNGVTL